MSNKPNAGFETSVNIPLSGIDPTKRRKRSHPYTNKLNEGIPSADFTPLPGWALVKREDGPEFAGNIALVGKSDEELRYETTTAEVIKLGAEEVTEKGAPVAWSIAAGDRIILRKFAGHDILLDGRDPYVIVSEADIDGVIEAGVEFECLS